MEKNDSNFIWGQRGPTVRNFPRHQAKDFIWGDKGPPITTTPRHAAVDFIWGDQKISA